MSNWDKYIKKIVTTVNLSTLNYKREYGNRTYMQYFQWYLPVDAKHWQRAKESVRHLMHLGITDVWLPPAYKGHTGMMDVGYGVYDLYDLGEFYQKGSIPTKYGTKEEYLDVIQEFHKHGIRVTGDIVLNHRMGADYTEDTFATLYEDANRLHVVVPKKKVSVWSHFTFPGRNRKYSSFEWHNDHFTGDSYNQLTDCNEYVLKLVGHTFSTKVSNEKGNYDYLMGADVDFTNEEAREELTKWGKWYMDTTDVDCLRLDALKHISHDFFPEWLSVLRRHESEKAMHRAMELAEKLAPSYGVNFGENREHIYNVLKAQIEGKDVHAVGESWERDINELKEYLKNSGKCMCLFDVPLHYRLQDASLKGRNYDLRTIFDNTLVKDDAEHAVTFVDNHDTQPHQALESWVEAWFKPLAYALILLREQGTPCVFYGDMYGIDYDEIPPVAELQELILARRRYAHGEQKDYFDHPNVIGWTRAGNGSSPMAVVMSNGDEGWKDMPLGEHKDEFVDILGHRQETVVIGEDGIGRFTCNGGSVSVWVKK